MSSSGPWTECTPVPIAAPDSAQPSLAMWRDTLHLVWVRDRVLLHSHRTEQGWSEPEKVATGEQPSLVATPEGRLHLLFANEFAGNYEIYHVMWNGARWSLPKNVSRTSGASTNPAAALAPDGTVNVVWEDTTPGYPVIYHGQSGEYVWRNAPIPNGRGSCPDLSFTPAGELLVAWQDRLSSTDRHDVFCCVYHDGIWSIPETVSDSPGNHSMLPRLASSPLGNSHLVWQEESGVPFRVLHAEHRGGRWTEATDISGTDEDCRSPQLAISRQGYIHVIWMQGLSLHFRVRAPESNAAWRTEEGTGASGSGQSGLAAAMGDDGRLFAAWAAYDEADAQNIYEVERAPVLQQSLFMPMIMR